MRTLAIPLAISIGVGVIGWLEDIPLFYLCVGVGVLFAAIPTGLLRFNEWLYRNIVKDKLAFNTIRINKELTEDGTVKTVSLGFQLHNTATFPIQFEVVELHTSLMKLVPPKKEYANKKISVSANCYGCRRIGSDLPNYLFHFSLCAIYAGYFSLKPPFCFQN